uniref:Hemoglobin subunit beta-1 n=1 Tax=Gadus morhua TaxID=8049 RepID=HBB1_GADMO|nr:RecName: Full=Hemoglobin subunit beta-1; AltName: Full=Beta-1-globin; AltName: Full=Hemoglobin beta-1 chain [Gadus morhua]
MVEWTAAERRHVEAVWSKIDIDVCGPLALQRCLIVYPWTQRYFGEFGDLSTDAAIVGNPKVAAHGVVALTGLRTALDHMDEIKSTYAALSVLHSEKLHVDPDNFRLLCECLTIVVAGKMGKKLSPEMQAAWQKYLCAVVSALGRQYH